MHQQHRWPPLYQEVRGWVTIFILAPLAVLSPILCWAAFLWLRHHAYLFTR